MGVFLRAEFHCLVTNMLAHAGLQNNYEFSLKCARNPAANSLGPLGVGPTQISLRLPAPGRPRLRAQRREDVRAGSGGRWESGRRTIERREREGVGEDKKEREARRCTSMMMMVVFLLCQKLTLPPSPLPSFFPIV